MTPITKERKAAERREKARVRSERARPRVGSCRARRARRPGSREAILAPGSATQTRAGFASYAGEQEDMPAPAIIPCFCSTSSAIWNAAPCVRQCSQRRRMARYQGNVSRIYFRADAGFANPEVYEYLEADG